MSEVHSSGALPGRTWRLMRSKHASALETGRRAAYSSGAAKIAAQIAKHFAGLAVIFVIVFLAIHTTFANQTTIGFAFLLAILCASATWGFSVAITMSFAAALAYDYYFLPPIGVFNISDPRDWVALGSFLATSAIGGYLSAWARREARTANQRRGETERLYAFSQSLLATPGPSELLDVIPRYFVESFQAEAAQLLLFDSREMHYPDIDEAAQFQRNVRVVSLRLGAEQLGMFRVSGTMPSQTTLDATAALIAIAVARARAIEQLVKTETAQRSEQFKSVLLDAIAHDFKTPLSSIKGSVSGLLADLYFGRDERKELLTVIDEECDRINRLIGSAADMARLDAGQMKMEKAAHSVDELISAALSECEMVLRERRIELDVHDGQCLFVGDLSLMKKVLLHLIDNANLYSSPGAPITIRTARDDASVLFSVEDRGPGIEESELARIFEKFYRGKGQRDRVDGTGMGLAIATAIVKAHGGTIEAKSSPGVGSTFTFRLPADLPVMR